MDKQVVSLKFLHVQSKPLIKVLGLCFLLSALNACDFLDTTSSPSIPKDDPGANVNLGTSYPAVRPVADDESISVATAPSSNTFRLVSAQKQNRNCPEGQSCTSSDAGQITYEFCPVNNPTIDTNPLDNLICSSTDYPGTRTFLVRAIEYSTSGDDSDISDGDVVSYRRYFYSGNRLDKVAVSDEFNANYHTLHDYTYDDENDPSDTHADIEDAEDNNSNNDNDGYNAVSLTRPKLRREYVCDIDTSSPSLLTCDRANAAEVIDYVYYDNGVLYRKEFDVDNTATIDHQKVYYYDGPVLERVEVDNFYNGVLDELYVYNRGGDATGRGLELTIDNDYISPKTRGFNIFVTYELDASNAVVRECYFEPGYPQTTGGDDIKDCNSGSRHNFQWVFTWTAGDCWAGGIDDIDPEARAIDYLCKQP